MTTATGAGNLPGGVPSAAGPTPPERAILVTTQGSGNTQVPIADGLGGYSWGTPGGGSGAAALGWIDITKAPYNADPTGATDATAAVQAAITAAVAAGGGTIYFPPGTYALRGAQQAGGSGATAYSGQIILPAIAYTAPLVVVSLLGSTPALGAYTWSDGYPAGGSILVATATSGNVVDVNAVGTGNPFGTFSNVECNFDDLTLVCPANPACGGLRLDRAGNAHIRRSAILAMSNAGAISQPTNGTYGVKLPGAGNYANISLEDGSISGWGIGLQHSEHAHLVNPIIQYNAVGIEINGGGHSCKYDNPSLQRNTTHIHVTGNAPIVGSIRIETSGVGWYLPTLELNDPNGYLQGNLMFERNASGAGGLIYAGAYNVNLRRLDTTTPANSLFPVAIADSFARVNQAGLGQMDSGQVYYQPQAWSISGNAAKSAASGTVQGNVVGYPPTWNPNVYQVTGTITPQGTGQAGLTLRRGPTNNVILVTLYPGNPIKLQKMIAGAFTVLGTGALSPVAGTTYVLSALVTRTAVSVYVNNTLQISYALNATDLGQFPTPASSVVGLFGYSPGASTWTAFSAAGLGENFNQGTATLVAGTVAVADPSVTANTVVRLTRQAAGGVMGNLSVALTAGTGFTINSDNAADTSTILWEVVSY